MPTISFFDAMISSSVRAVAVGAASVAATATPIIAPANHDCNLFICPLLARDCRVSCDRVACDGRT